MRVSWLSAVGGAALVGWTVASIVRTLVVARGLPSLLAKVVDGGVWLGFLAVARPLRRYERKDAVLALYGPVSLLALLVVWLSLLVAGYGLLLGAFGDAGGRGGLRAAGSALFTLGFAEPRNTAQATVAFVAAATGLVVVALEIAYLPTLYNAFNRRERLVTMLESRAGAPSWGPELLVRHQLVDLVDDLPEFYGQWELWAADVAESHTTYPVLVGFRSPGPYQSWLIALLAVLDAAALHLALCPRTAPPQARLCLRMGFTCLRNVAGALGLRHDPDPEPEDPIELTFEEFRDAVRQLDAAGFARERSPEEAWVHFRGWRVNYEGVAYALADRLVAPLAPWSGSRRGLRQRPTPPRRPPHREPRGG